MTEKSEPSIAAALRRGREARGETLEQVHQKLGVSLKILQGIESEQYDVVEPIYARLAIWHYAEHVGLGGDEMAARFEREVGLPEAPVPMKTGDGSRVEILPTSAVTTFLQRQSLGRLIGIGALILAILIALLSYLGGEDDETSYEQADDFLAAPLSASQPAPTTSPPPQAGTGRQETAGTVEGPASTNTGTASQETAPVAMAPESAATSADDRGEPESAPAGQESTPPPAETSADTTGDEALDEAASGEEVVIDAPAVETPATEPTTEPPVDDQQPVSPQTTAEPTPDDELASDAAGDTDSAPLAVSSRGVGVSGGTLLLEAQAIDSTWVQVQWDGIDGIEEIIPKGDVRRWTANRYFLVRAGRAHGVRFRLQGALLGEGRLGDATRVLRFRAEPEGYQLLGPELEPLGDFTPLPAAETDPPERP